jgi:DNA-directed RNA polymerase specialized sigma24 family protein
MSGNANDAYAEAMLGCFEALCRTAFRPTRNKSRAEDLVQETCLRAWRSLAQLHRLPGV